LAHMNARRKINADPLYTNGAHVVGTCLVTVVCRFIFIWILGDLRHSQDVGAPWWKLVGPRWASGSDRISIALLVRGELLNALSLKTGSKAFGVKGSRRRALVPAVGVRQIGDLLSDYV